MTIHFKIIQRMFIVVIFLVGLRFYLRCPKRLRNSKKKLEDSIEKGQEAQSEAEKWDEEKARLLDEIWKLKNRQKWLSHQKEKYGVYIEKQRKVIEGLERRKNEAERIRIALEPFLDEVKERLKALVENDIPFFPEERKQRLQFITDSLNDYHLTLSEKTKRVLEALQVEANYGATTEVSDAAVETENGLLQVKLLKLGRVALYYQTEDGKQSGWYNKKTARWESLPREFEREIGRAMEIAEKKRTPELLDLPLGRPKQ